LQHLRAALSRWEAETGKGPSPKGQPSDL
jgi:hypothetical protein